MEFSVTRQVCQYQYINTSETKETYIDIEMRDVIKIVVKIKWYWCGEVSGDQDLK